jgi:hypothetical protein
LAGENNIPVILSVNITSTLEDTPFTILAENIEYFDADGDDIEDIEVLAGGNYTFAGTTITPVHDYFGNIFVSLRISDGTDWSDVYVHTVVVISVNDAPVAEDMTVTTRQNQPKTIIVPVFDVDGTVTNIYLETNPQNGFAGVSGLNIVYTPISTYFGSDEIKWFAKDNNGAFSNIATISITVTQNTAPVITSTAPSTATVGQEYVYAVIADDIENDVLTYSLSNAPTGMVITDNTITWTPTAGTTTSGIVTVTVSDGLLNDTENFIISVSPVGINNISEGNITVYPNPTSGKLKIKNEELKIENIVVTDITGKIIYRKDVACNVSIETIDLTTQPSGIYILKIETETGFFVEKIIKQ